MYLAFDIGIKNLAYCLINYDKKEPKKYSIEDWGIINLTLTDSEGVSNICVCQPCKRPAKWCNINDKSLKYCGIHSKKEDTKCLLDLKKIPCSKAKCKSAAKFYDPVSKIYGCGRHSKDFSENKTELYQKKATSIPLLVLSRLLFKKMEEYPQFLNATHIVIENQPVLKNPTMKSIQMILYSYFISKETEIKKFENIALISASNKLKVYKGPSNETIKNIANIKSKYTKNKKLAVEHCKLLLEEDKNNENWSKFYDEYKSKRDDLADAYLMCRYYIG